MTSESAESFGTAIAHAQRLMKGTKEGRGKPTQQEISMFVASIALTYAAWEGYVEDVAVELTDFLAENATPEQVPQSARAAIESRNPTAWELVLDPKWSGLWRRQVTEYAKGTPGDKPPFGMNTANQANVTQLFKRVGVSPWENLDKEDVSGVDKLVRERGRVVHTAGAPDNFRKALATEHLDRIVRVVAVIDENLAKQAEDLLQQRPW